MIDLLKDISKTDITDKECLPQLCAQLDQLEPYLKKEKKKAKLLFFIHEFFHLFVYYIALTNILYNAAPSAFPNSPRFTIFLNLIPGIGHGFWASVLWFLIIYIVPTIITKVFSSLIGYPARDIQPITQQDISKYENVQSAAVVERMENIQRMYTVDGCTGFSFLAGVFSIVISLSFITVSGAAIVALIFNGIVELIWNTGSDFVFSDSRSNAHNVIKEVINRPEEMEKKRLAEEAEARRIAQAEEEAEARRIAQAEEEARVQAEEQRKHEENLAKCQAIYDEAVATGIIDEEKLLEAASFGHHDAALLLADHLRGEAGSGEYTNKESHQKFELAYETLSNLERCGTHSPDSKVVYLVLSSFCGDKDSHQDRDILDQLRYIKKHEQLSEEKRDLCDRFIRLLVEKINIIDNPPPPPKCFYRHGNLCTKDETATYLVHCNGRCIDYKPEH